MLETSKSDNERSEGYIITLGQSVMLWDDGISATLPDNDGGTTGIGAIIYYATSFLSRWSYFIINAVLMTFAIRCAIQRKDYLCNFHTCFLLWIFQVLVEKRRKATYKHHIIFIDSGNLSTARQRTGLYEA